MDSIPTSVTPNKSLQPTPVGVVSSADAGYVIVPAWLSFFSLGGIMWWAAFFLRAVQMIGQGCLGFRDGDVTNPATGHRVTERQFQVTTSTCGMRGKVANRKKERLSGVQPLTHPRESWMGDQT
jgi:hypothetical protein